MILTSLAVFFSGFGYLILSPESAEALYMMSAVFIAMAASSYLL